jgi:hypothetical protein
LVKKEPIILPGLFPNEVCGFMESLKEFVQYISFIEGSSLFLDLQMKVIVIESLLFILLLVGIVIAWNNYKKVFKEVIVRQKQSLVSLKKEEK